MLIGGSGLYSNRHRRQTGFRKLNLALLLSIDLRKRRCIKGNQLGAFHKAAVGAHMMVPGRQRRGEYETRKFIFH